MTNSVMEGQIDLFSYLKTLDSQPAVAPLRKPVAVASPQEYLHKGEVLTSLAKEEMVAQVGDITAVKEKLFSIKQQEYLPELIQKASRAVTRPLLISAYAEDFKGDAMDQLHSIITVPFTLVRATETGVGGYKVAHTDADAGKVAYIEVAETGRPAIRSYGPILGRQWVRSNSQSVLFKDGSCCCDIAVLLAWLVVISYVNDVLSGNEPELLEGYKATLALNKPPTAECLNDTLLCIRKNIASTLTYECCGTHVTDGAAALRVMLKDGAYVDSAPSLRPKQVSIDILGHLIGMPIEIKGIKGNDAESPVLPGSLDETMLWYDKASFVDGLGRIDLADLCTYAHRSGYVWPIPAVRYGAHYKVYCLINEIFNLTLKKNQERVEEKRYLDGLRAEYARSFMTKHNIPQATVKEMEDSGFNKYFGYVEFDEDCDIDKVREVEAEFSAFKDTYVSGFDSSKVQLRFRKLGQHKATGLYYYTIACLCVDLRHPSSFVHEFGHCIDHSSGKLSDRGDFYVIKYIYEKDVRAAMEADDGLKGRLSSGGKYNLGYYLLSTEIFARCFEMYCTRKLGIKASICVPEKGFAYPEDPELDKRVFEYFDRLLDTFAAAKAA